MSKRPVAEYSPILIGHRGAPGYFPEHTRSSYALACEMGVDAVEPDVVVTLDGVLVVRHENEISGTTDVSDRAEFAARKTSKMVDGALITGWFTEDFTWAELRTLRCKERLPHIRSASAAHDGTEPILSLRELLKLIRTESVRLERDIAVVVEVKHANYFLGIGYDLATLLVEELVHVGWPMCRELLTIESFELGVLRKLQLTGLSASYVFLLESTGSAPDEVPDAMGLTRTYEWYRSDEGLRMLSALVDGISVAKKDVISSMEQQPQKHLVMRAHAHGLLVYTWTLRPENTFLEQRFRSKSLKKSSFGSWQGEWENILSSGVDGIFVDHPDLARQLVPKRK